VGVWRRGAGRAGGDVAFEDTQAGGGVGGAGGGAGGVWGVVVDGGDERRVCRLVGGGGREEGREEGGGRPDGAYSLVFSLSVVSSALPPSLPPSLPHNTDASTPGATAMEAGSGLNTLQSSPTSSLALPLPNMVPPVLLTVISMLASLRVSRPWRI